VAGRGPGTDDRRDRDVPEPKADGGHSADPEFVVELPPEPVDVLAHGPRSLLVEQFEQLKHFGRTEHHGYAATAVWLLQGFGRATSLVRVASDRATDLVF
jgi:hypothetical protein